MGLLAALLRHRPEHPPVPEGRLFGFADPPDTPSRANAREWSHEASQSGTGPGA